MFANKIGTDVVHNFDTVHDQIDLVGFAGVSSFADVQAHLANDASGNAKITLGDGETITLTGVDAASLNAGDFVFDQTPVTYNSGTMVISDGALLPISGVVDNTGAIQLGSAGSETDLEIVQHGATLQGGGTLRLSDNTENVIFGSDPSVTLTNVDNTISGAGQLGDGQMTLVNEGTIIATGSNALIIDTGDQRHRQHRHPGSHRKRRARRAQRSRQRRHAVGERRRGDPGRQCQRQRLGAHFGQRQCRDRRSLQRARRVR